jgi:hypothetical protein
MKALRSPASNLDQFIFNFKKENKLMIYKKVIAAFLLMSCVQNANSVEQYDTWEKIKDTVAVYIEDHANQKILVAIDLDDTLVYNASSDLISETIPEFFKMLKEKKIPFFGLTASCSLGWKKRRETFNTTKLNTFFCNQECGNIFQDDWNRDSDTNKAYYWDKEYSIMYSTRLLTHLMEKHNIFEDNLPTPIPRCVTSDWNKFVISSKGDVFTDAIGDGIINKPDTVIFIDDSGPNISEMNSACNELQIGYLGIRCNCVKKVNRR